MTRIVEPFRRMNADAAVMEFMPKRLTAEESDVLADRIQKRLAERGFGLFAAELRETGSFIGFVGFSAPAFEAHFTPCVEIGWRLAREFWGSGYATEGAYAVLRLAFMSLIAGSCVGHRGIERALAKGDGAAGNGTKHKG